MSRYRIPGHDERFVRLSNDGVIGLFRVVGNGSAEAKRSYIISFGWVLVPEQGNGSRATHYFHAVCRESELLREEAR